MFHFISNIVKRTKLLMALNNNSIQTIINKPGFNNVGIIILKNDNMKQPVESLLSGTELEKNQSAKQELIRILEEVAKKTPANIKQLLKDKTVGQLLKKRDEEGVFKEKMDKIAQYVKQQFTNALKVHSDEFIDEELAKWEI